MSETSPLDLKGEWGNSLVRKNVPSLCRESLETQRKDDIRAVLGVERIEFEAKYLGLPTQMEDRRRNISNL
jgi:hypothetical protein